MLEPLTPVDEKRGIEVLRRIQERLDHRVQPTVRDAGLTEGEARWMGNEGLFSLADSMPWNKAAHKTTTFEDRFLIVEISDTAKGFLIDAGEPPPPLQPVQIVTPPVSKLVKTARWFGRNLWVLISAGLVAAVVFFVQKILKDRYPDATTATNSAPRITNTTALSTAVQPITTNSQVTRFAVTNPAAITNFPK